MIFKVSAQPVQIGSPAPDFNLADVHGKTCRQAPGTGQGARKEHQSFNKAMEYGQVTTAIEGKKENA